MKSRQCNIQRFFIAVKIDNFQLNSFDYFHIFAQNIYCGYTLEPPSEAVQTIITHNICFRAKIKKNNVYPF